MLGRMSLDRQARLDAIPAYLDEPPADPAIDLSVDG